MDRNWPKDFEEDNKIVEKFTVAMLTKTNNRQTGYDLKSSLQSFC